MLARGIAIIPHPVYKPINNFLSVHPCRFPYFNKRGIRFTSSRIA